MANDILNSELFQAQPTEKKTISAKPTTETKKEGGSLFDNLLKDAKTKVDEGNSTQLNKEVKGKTLPTPSNQHTTVKKESLESVSPEVSKAIIQKDDQGEVVKKSFPFEKIQLNENVKKSVSTTNATTVIQTITPKTEDITHEKSIQDTIDVKTSKKNPLLNDTVNKGILSKEIKGEEKKPLSLLDKMMQDLKKDRQVDDKNLIKSVSLEKSEVNSSKIGKEIHLEEQAIVFPEKSVKNRDDTTKSIPINSTPKKKEELAKEIVKSNISPTIEEKKGLILEKENHSLKVETTNSKVSKPTSLLDKMVQEIQDTSIEENKENEVQKTISKTTFKSDENVGKQFVELSAGIQLENTPNESHFEKRETKETKILSSLVDSLSGKTKIQKKVDETTKLESLQDSKGQFGANIFLSNQKVQGEILSKQKLTEAKEVLKDGEKTIKTVKKTADILELKANNIELVSEVENTHTTLKQTIIKSNDLGLHTQQTFLNRVFLNKEMNEQLLHSKGIEEKVTEIKMVTEDSKKTNSDVTLTVEKNLVETFTTKVIASKQAMGSFMSDVARNMYLNYKPPVTAFKINLDPLNLGSIAIVMRSNRGENSLSVSLNMSQNSTYETMNENKSMLQNALGKVFNQNEGNISLDFGMQSDSSNQEFEQQKENQQNQQIIQNKDNVERIREKDEQIIDLDTTKSYM